MATLRSFAAAGIIGLALTVAATSIFCAEVQNGGWPDDGSGNTPNPDGGTDGGGDMTWHCFTGTAASEPQLFDTCTEAEKVDRATYVPDTLWKPQDPLP